MGTRVLLTPELALPADGPFIVCKAGETIQVVNEGISRLNTQDYCFLILLRTLERRPHTPDRMNAAAPEGRPGGGSVT